MICKKCGASFENDNGICNSCGFNNITVTDIFNIECDEILNDNRVDTVTNTKQDKALNNNITSNINTINNSQLNSISNQNSEVNNLNNNTIDLNYNNQVQQISSDIYNKNVIDSSIATPVNQMPNIDVNSNKTSVSSEIKLENKNTHESIKYGSIDKGDTLPDEGLLRIYIGPNCDKIMSGKFSIPAFFLGPLYITYRKMWILSIIYLLEILLQFKLNSLICLIIPLITNIILAFTFNKLYMGSCMNKIRIIKSKIKDKEEQKYECARKGGSSLAHSLIYFNIVFIIAILILILSIASNIGATITGLFESSDDTIESGFYNHI